MKNFKFAFALAALFFVAFSAFKTMPNSKSLTVSWFEYIGGDLDDVNSYRVVSGEPCMGSEQFCGIEATIANPQAIPALQRPDEDELLDLYEVNHFTEEIPSTSFKEIQ